MRLCSVGRPGDRGVGPATAGKQMKTLLISSAFEEVSLVTATKDNAKGSRASEESHYPIGLAYVFSYLESRGHEVELLNLNSYSSDACLEKVQEALHRFGPDVVGFQVLTANRTSTFRLFECAHQECPKALLVCGGIHTTIMYDQILTRYPFVVAVLGEGEITFAELVEAAASPELDLSRIAGLAYHSNGKVVTTAPRNLVANLDELPFPKHELFFANERTCGCLLTSRGCPFACSFCCLDHMSKRRVRFRSVENIVAEIEHMVASFPKMTRLWIHDDTFFVDNERVIRFCDEIVKRGIKLDFVCSGRAKPLSARLVSKLVEAGFSMVMLGLESGDNSVLKSCRKGITQKDMLAAFRLFAGTPIELKVFLIVGLPGETLATVQETIRFVKRLQKIKYTHFEGAAILTVYPGTEVYTIVRSKGLIDDAFWLSDGATPVFTVEHGLDTLFMFQGLINESLCLGKAFSLRGLIAQYDTLPSAAVYLLKRGRHALPLVDQAMFRALPRPIYSSIRRAYRFARGKVSASRR